MPEPPIVRVASLRAMGASDRELRSARSSLQRVAPGAYAATSALSESEAHLVRARAISARLRSVAGSHLTAALALGLPVPRASLATVHLSPRDGRIGNPKSGPGYKMHYRPVGPEDSIEVRGIVVTAPLRTVLDCPQVLSTDWAVAVADAAVHAGMATLDSLVARASATRGVRGAERIRSLAGLVSARAESPGESLLRMRLRRMGIEAREQVVLAGVPGNPRVDFLVDECLVIEFDGEAKYSLSGDPEQAHLHEKSRNESISEAGYVLLHVTWRQLWDEPALARRVNAARARAARYSRAGRATR